MLSGLDKGLWYTPTMYFKSKKIPLLILGLVSLALSRAVFLFINDPEGQNLVVVIGLAVIIYCLFLATYSAFRFLLK